MNKKIAFLFPGQGCQFYHMAKPLYQQDLFFHRWLNEANQTAYEVLGINLLNHLFSPNHPPFSPLNQLLHSQLLIALISAGIAHTLVYYGVEPDLLIGASLGEISASLFTGIINLQDFLRSTYHHIQTFENTCQAGVMLALYASPIVLQKLNFSQFGFELCATNFDEQIVIGGLCSQLDDMLLHLKHHDISYEPLPVKIAFHTHYIEPAEHAFKQALPKPAFQISTFPIYSSAIIGRVENFSPEYYWTVVRKPIEFSSLIRNIEEESSIIYVDVGPAGNLATAVEQNIKNNIQGKCHKILTPFTREINLKLKSEQINNIKSGL